MGEVGGWVRWGGEVGERPCILSLLFFLED